MSNSIDSMSDRFILSIHVQKLGHKLEEIRERALHNIISKLEHGFLYDNDLARSKEILSKLFEWFLFERCCQQDLVLRLILRILKSESGVILTNHYGSKTIESEVRKIRSNIEPRYFTLVDDILDFLRQFNKIHEDVPPLQSDLPLSYRTLESERTGVGTTGTAIEGYIQQKSSADVASGLLLPRSTSQSEDDNLPVVDQKNGVECLTNFTLKWQYLIPSDGGVLTAIENSLRNPTEPAQLLNSLEFFHDVILQDFPAEIFLQRPYIVQLFYDYLKTPTSTRLTHLILKCLLKLTKQIIIRICYYEDPCMHNSKQNISPQIIATNFSPTSSTTQTDTARSYIQNFGTQDHNFNYQEDDVELLKANQLPLPQFCFTTMTSILDFICFKTEHFNDARTKRKNFVSVNVALILFNEIVILLSLCFKPDAWDKTPSNPVVVNTLRQFDEVLTKFAEALEHFRLEVGLNDFDKTRRSVHMYLLCSCANLLLKFIPLKKADVILPRSFKNALANLLLDSVLARLYPEVHETVLLFVKEFGDHFGTDSMTRYKDVKDVYGSVTAFLKFSRSYKTLPILEAIKLARESVDCLEFHRNFNFLNTIVSLFANQLPLCTSHPNAFEVSEEVILLLLGHNDLEIQEESYKLCHARILTVIGTKSNLSGTGAPGSQILFLLRAPILAELSAHGLRSENNQIKKYADEILVHILKCKILVSDEIWNKVVEALITSLPILACHADKSSALGRAIISLLDPDSAISYFIPPIEVLKGNLRLLFVDDNLTRIEAVSRLMWLLGSQTDSRNLLPRINTLHNKSLESLCQVQRVLDVNKSRMLQHFYQPSALIQVLQLLNSENVEPVIRRSALTQISVMMEDSLLHLTFIERGGVATIVDIMKSALVENSYKDYVDCIISAVSILKNLCLYNPTIRQELSNDIDVYYYTLRGLFIFCAEDRTRQDCSTLLCLLLFDHYILGSPYKANFSLPVVVVDKLVLPFTCKTHWGTSRYGKSSLAATLLDDKWCASCIQLHWNSEFFGGFKKILSWNEINYSECDSTQFSNKLWLKSADLTILKSSSLDYCLAKYLTDIQNATSHTSVVDCFNKLQFYLNFYVLTKDDNNCDRKDILMLPWEYTLLRFLSAPPANEEDTILLTCCLKLLTILVPLYTVEDKFCWVITILKDSGQCLPNLLLAEFSPEHHEIAQLNRELLSLASICVWHEQQYFDLHLSTFGGNLTTNSWFYLTKIIADNLKFNNGDPFYNLAHLDAVLLCLVHLTSAIGWSCSKSGSLPKEPIPGLILDLCELVGTFHCGKGSVANVSLMGVSITRNVFLILNHLLAELQFFNAKNWEMCFIGESVVERNLLDVAYTLLTSRDVVLRAAIWQLLAGLSISSRASIELVQEIRDDTNSNGIWEIAMATLLDHEEASVVKENAANLLTNLTSHTLLPGSDFVMITTLTPTSSKENNNVIDAILYLLEDFKFYSELETMLACLYLKIKCVVEEEKNCLDRPSSARLITKGEFSFAYTKNIVQDSPKSSGRTLDCLMFVAPSLVRNLTGLLQNLLILTQNEIIGALQEHSLVKLFFRCLSNPPNGIKDTKDLSLYCDVLEMNSAICSLLTKAVGNNYTCLGMVLQTRDCLNVMLSLLNPDLYLTTLAQLVYLRNRLWTEIFGLIATLLDGSSMKFAEETTPANFRALDALSIVSSVLNECGHRPFLQTLCEAISTNSSSDLQQSALSSLTSLLRIESKSCLEDFKLPETTPSWISIQDVLDTYRTPRTPSSDENERDHSESHRKVNLLWEKSNRKITPRERMDVLQNAYFGQVNFQESTRSGRHTENGEPLMAGAELCRILLHLYDVSNLRSKDSRCTKKKTVVINTLTSILCVSREAKKLALQCGLVEMTVQQFRELHVKLSLESVESLRRANDKKRVCPLLKDLGSLVGLITNFMLGDESVKCAISTFGFSDLMHKLWIWFCVERVLLNDALKMLCTYTTDCYLAVQSLPLTSSAAGSGPRKAPSNFSLLHEIVAIVSREMDLVSRMHGLNILELSFHLLHNACSVVECRTILAKSNLLQSLSRLHPAITKRQKPWDNVELLWLELLLTLTGYPEGQAYVAKAGEALDLVMMFTVNSRLPNKKTALLVLRNIAFYQQNRAKLLNSDEFLGILQSKLSNSNIEEQNIIVTIIWALSANSQRAKLVLKCAGLDVKLQDCLKRINLTPDEYVDREIIDRMHFVYSILKEGDKTK